MLRKILALVTGTILLILGFMFSVVILTAVAVIGLVIGGYLLWKTRKIRRAMQEQAGDGRVIEGEAVVVEPHPGRMNKVLPGQSPDNP
jgi:hypothetical protein